jgi:ribonuclease BN (tRNA processing enzyme)
MDQSPAFFSECFAVHEYDPSRTLAVGPLQVSFVPVRHIPHTYAIRVRGSGEMAYSADTGPCDGLAQVARDSDLFLCECANVEQSDYPFHLTPRQAGAAAEKAGARRLLLTHRWWVYGKESTVAEAREQFGGPVELAREDMQVTIGR